MDFYFVSNSPAQTTRIFNLEKDCSMRESICNGCGIDTTPRTGKRGYRSGKRTGEYAYSRRTDLWEYYMVTAAVWKAAGMPSSTVTDNQFDRNFLCIGCLELRIGRRLTALDFAVCPINDPEHRCNTPRLRDRLNDQLPQSRKDYYADVRKYYGRPWLALQPRENPRS
jgi:hypothetical protein